MGFFDFLNARGKSQVQPKDIDEIFDLASKDVAYRPLFYRTILETDLYVLIFPDGNLPSGQSVSDGNTTIQVRTLSDGKVPVFTSTEKIFDNGVIKEQVNYVAMNGTALFSMFKNAPTILLNPYSRVSKEFLPEEIERLLKGDLFTVDDEYTIQKGTQISLGMPAAYPTDLVCTLKKYCSTRTEVGEVYIALMHDASKNEVPHLLIGLYIEGNVREIFGEVAQIIKPYIPHGEPVDMINVAEKNKTAKMLRQKQYKVY